MSFYPDVSHWHPVVNWSIVKQNCPFIISKATQRTNYTDPTLKDFIKGCETNNIPYWLFVFLAKGNELAQAKYMVSVCKPLAGNNFMGYVLDVEKGNAAANVKSALDYIQTQSEKTLLYTGYKDYAMYKNLIDGRGKNCAWWESRYGTNTGVYLAKFPCHSGVDLYQFTSKGNCPGISGRCDLSMLTGTLPESWFTSNPVSPVKAGNPYAEPTSNVKLGDKGNNVKWVQWCLWKFGMLVNSKGVLSDANIDGVFGTMTDTQVKTAQKRLGLVPDGIVGKNTIAAFKKVL